MREIKFRAWDKKEREMFYGVENAYDTLGSMLNTAGEKIEYDWSNFEEVIDLAKEGKLVLMQYTGLKDKNGKEIYEGDIIKNGSDIFLVKWENIGCDYHGGVGWSLDDPDGDRDPKKLEVVGNKWQNPELLKE